MSIENTIDSNSRIVKYIICSAPIEYQINGYDIYDSFDLVSRGKLSAPLVKDADKIIANYDFPFDMYKIKKIYTATKGQTLETAKLILQTKKLAKVEITPLTSLDNIKFSMPQLITKAEFGSLRYETAIKLARREFVAKLFGSQLLESFDSVTERIREFVSLIDGDRENLLSITHSFYLKILEIYLKNPLILFDINALLKEFNPDQKPYAPLAGFNLAAS